LDETEFHGKSQWKNTGAKVSVVCCTSFRL